MEPLAVDLSVLRALLTPDIKLVPGRALMARVVTADGSGRGALSIAGFITEAELPRDVRAGQDLRLVVRDVSAERVLLGVQTGAGPAPAATPPPMAPVPLPPPVPLPGGGTVQVTERDGREASGNAAATHTLALRYDAPALGPVDLRVALDPASLQVSVTVSPGALEAARGGAEALRAALAASLSRPVSVTVGPRREPVDVYA